MKREDFVFDHMDDEYEDYWFKVVGDTKDRAYKEVHGNVHGFSDRGCLFQ